MDLASGSPTTICEWTLATLARLWEHAQVTPDNTILLRHDGNSISSSSGDQ